MATRYGADDVSIAKPGTPQANALLVKPRMAQELLLYIIT
jgi:hypothetical protein